MAISLNNHESRISVLEKRGSGTVDMCMYRGTRKENNPVFNIQNSITRSWCTRQPDGTFLLQAGSYIVKVTSEISLHTTGGQTWTFKVTCGSFQDTMSHTRDNYGHGDGGIIASFTISSPTIMALYFEPSRYWNYTEPSYIQIWKVE